MKKFNFIFLSFLFLMGCSVKKIALRSVAEMLQNGSSAFYEESDPKIARTALESQLKLLEVLLKNDPKNLTLLLQATQGFGAYSFLFLEEEEPARAKIFYERGLKYGNSYLEPKMNRGFTVKDVPILFWTAYCWAGLSNLSRDNPQAIADLPKIEKMMREVDSLSPSYFYGGPDLFFGGVYGSKPKILGGDLEKAKLHFEKAFTVSQRSFLMAQILFVQYVAIPSQDRDLFKKIITEVLEFPLENFPEQRLSNQIAKERAQKLLSRIDEYF